jgi:hypothetical protein
MIEYITETGMFGYLWIMCLIISIGVSYRFIKRNGFTTFIKATMPVIIMLVMSNFLATELIGKSKYDMALTMAKDLWFLMGAVFIQTVLLICDKDSIEFWHNKKRGE